MMNMFGYIDNDKEKVQRMVKNILPSTLEELLRSYLPVRKSGKATGIIIVLN